MDNQNYNGTGSMIAPAAPPVPQDLAKEKTDNKLYLIIGLVVSIVVALVFIGLFVWMYVQFDSVSTDVEGQINQAVATAVNENSVKLEGEFAEREKEPNRTFSGPEIYGHLTFTYPKTWSVYVQADASKGGNYEAYFSPKQVEPINNSTPNALRFSVINQSFESTIKTYESYVNSKRLSLKVIQVDGKTAHLYTGTLTNNLSGAVCIIEIRDKTVLLQTDSELYMADFMKLLESITYNS